MSSIVARVFGQALAVGALSSSFATMPPESRGMSAEVLIFPDKSLPGTAAAASCSQSATSSWRALTGASGLIELAVESLVLDF
jgi:hypothetical protein